MKCRLYTTDSDTCLEFNNRAKAFIYTDKQSINNFLLLTIYDNSHQVSVFNTFSKAEGQIEYFTNEFEALRYIGSFL